MFGGGGSIQAMQSSLRNNRNLLLRNNPFRDRLKTMKTGHVEGRVFKQFSKEEMHQFRQELKRKKAYNQKVSVFVIILTMAVLIGIIMLINGLTIS